jgi:hypothetical protein
VAPAAGAAVEGDRTFLVRHTLVWVLDSLAERGPIVLVVDDLRWADGASLRWLAYLARRIGELPVLLLAALRTGEEPAAPDAVGELQAVAGTGLLRPAPLSPAAVGALAFAQLGAGDPEFARRCYVATAGNPLLVRELLRGASEEGLAPTAESAARLEALAAQRLGDRVVRRLGVIAIGLTAGRPRPIARRGDPRAATAQDAWLGLRRRDRPRQRPRLRPS